MNRGGSHGRHRDLVLQICALNPCTSPTYPSIQNIHCQGKPELSIMGILKLYGDSSVTSYRLRIGDKRIIAYYIDLLPIILIKLPALKTLSQRFQTSMSISVSSCVHISTTRQHTSCRNWRSPHFPALTGLCW